MRAFIPTISAVLLGFASLAAGGNVQAGARPGDAPDSHHSSRTYHAGVLRVAHGDRYGYHVHYDRHHRYNTGQHRLRDNRYTGHHRGHLHTKRKHWQHQHDGHRHWKRHAPVHRFFAYEPPHHRRYPGSDAYRDTRHYRRYTDRDRIALRRDRSHAERMRGDGRRYHPLTDRGRPGNRHRHLHQDRDQMQSGRQRPGMERGSPDNRHRRPDSDRAGKDNRQERPGPARGQVERRRPRADAAGTTGRGEWGKRRQPRAGMV